MTCCIFCRDLVFRPFEKRLLTLSVVHNQVGFDTSVYAAAVEVGENRGMGSIVAIKAWSQANSAWQVVYSGSPDLEIEPWCRLTNQYHVFTTSKFCQPSFVTNRVRIELDTYAVADWNELDYVKLTGSVELRNGALKSTPADTEHMAQVVYIPNANFNGNDSFSFFATDCGYYLNHGSATSHVNLSVTAHNDGPNVENSTVELLCEPNVSYPITLFATDVDAHAPLVFEISELPDEATLLSGDASSDDDDPTVITQEMVPATLTSEVVRFRAEYNANEPPVSSYAFAFTAIDEYGMASAAAAVRVKCSWSRCRPGQYFNVSKLRCRDCPIGTFAHGMGVRFECTPCSKGTHEDREGSSGCQICENGMIALDEGLDFCETCPNGATCLDEKSMVVKEGYWRHSEQKITKILPCPLASFACKGGNSSAGALCHDGYLGPLCAECAGQSAMNWGRTRCVPCSAYEEIYWQYGVLVAVAVALAGAAYMLYRAKRFKRYIEKFKQLRRTGTTKTMILFMCAQVGQTQVVSVGIVHLFVVCVPLTQKKIMIIAGDSRVLGCGD